MAFQFAGAAAGANDALQQILAAKRAEFMQQQEMAAREAAAKQQAEQFAQNLALNRDELGVRQMQMTADNQDRTSQRERQTRLDTEAATDRERARGQEQNQLGVRRMIGEFLTQRGSKPLDAASRNQLTGMGLAEGVELPQAVTDDPEADARRAGMIADATAKAQARYRQPTQQSRQQQWVIRNGVPTPIAVGTAQPGDRPYDAVAARQSAPPANEKDAADLKTRSVGLARRLYDPVTKKAHAGIDAATGAYELRGFTQDAVDFNSLRDQLVAALALPNLAALKGPMSDKDILFVKQLATRLENRRLSRPETERAISEAIAFLDPASAVGGNSEDALLDELLGGGQ